MPHQEKRPNHQGRNTWCHSGASLSGFTEFHAQPQEIVMKKFAVVLAVAVGAVVIVVAAFGGVAAHADTTTDTDACLDGHSTMVSVTPCGPNTPSVAYVCSHGAAHLVQGNTDYCKPPAVVTVGESELGTSFVPRLFAPTRLDVAMRRTSLQSMRFRCARLGGSRLVVSHGFYVCRGVKH